ncbi:MAG TPA: inorganic phosphate transporter [Vicinamibacterales bacterium]|nr:inorganic phosphate transporter [Vicinamibacterales bacterium]
MSTRLSLLFGGLLLLATVGFLVWGLGYTGYGHVTLFVLATLFGLFMAFNIGGNDVANSFGTSVGAGTLTLTQALAVAAIFEVSGAMIAGGEVTETIRNDIVDLSGIPVDPLQFALVMMSALIAAAVWLLYATRMGYPVSTTHSIVGGIVGSSIALGVSLEGASTAFALVQWGEVANIGLSWLVSPLLGGAASYALFHAIKTRILLYNEQADAQLKVIKAEKKAHKQRHKTAFERLSEIERVAYASAMARDSQTRLDEDFTPDDLETEYFRELFRIEQKRDEIKAFYALQVYVPFLAALGAALVAAMLIFKGLKNVQVGLSTVNGYLVVMMVGASVWMAIYIFTRTLKGRTLDKSTFLLFSWMQVFTASGFAFSHGSNDIANAVGPFAAVLDVLRQGAVGTTAPVPPGVMLTFGIALVAGLWFIGKEVITTVGHNITVMHPASGFSAELSAAGVVLMASALGIPVSSTHILIGAVLGIGLVNRQTNWGLMKPIALAWVITLPASAGLSALAYAVLTQIL